MGQPSGPGADLGVVWVVTFKPPKPKWKRSNAQFLMKTFGGHILLTNTICYLLKNNCDEKKKRLTEESPFLVLNALLIPFLKKIKSDF